MPVAENESAPILLFYGKKQMVKGEVFPREICVFPLFGKKDGKWNKIIKIIHF
jgi:hypothetical protein